jgi:flagellar basal body-associated protein FliL
LKRGAPMALWSDDEVEERGEDSGRDSSRGFARGFARVLAVVAGLLVLALVAGTIYGLASGTRQRKLARESDRAQVAADLAGHASFTAIGTVRAKSADAKAAVVVATIAFPYDSRDKAFADELARKAPVLKAAAESLLSSRKADDLTPAFEGAVKAALRDSFNSRLSLGKVTEIWLSDFAVIR